VDQVVVMRRGVAGLGWHVVVALLAVDHGHPLDVVVVVMVVLVPPLDQLLLSFV
jgi:hypothetical protein